MKALGMIEVRGYLGAIAACDAALKAADVELNNAEVIRGGLTTVELVGDVAAVNAAVDAGVAVVRSLDCLISHHVIARLDEQTKVVTTSRKKLQPDKEDKLLQEENRPAQKNSEPETEAAIDTADTGADKSSLRAELIQLKVVDLRKRAYQMNLQTLKKSEIKFANKQKLINAIVTEVERSE